VFVGSGIFKSDNPAVRAKAIVDAVAHFNEPAIIAEVSKGLGEAMRGIAVQSMREEDKVQGRGW
jgi:pyridoxal 5'-phosphate synthase pdxS subunit